MEKVKEFEKAAIEAVTALRNELGAKCVNIEVHVDNYDKSCNTRVTFFTSIQNDACGCDPAFKVE